MASQPAAPTPGPSTLPAVTGRRLFIGNIAAGVDQCVVKVTHTTMLTGWSFVLSKAFGKVGAITALDLPFHHSGPSKGKLRGYAFVEYASAEDAQRAIAACDGKLLRGRKINVSLATSVPVDNSASRPRRPSAPKPTALSLAKEQRKPRGTTSSIAALEAKLGSLASSPYAHASGLPAAKSPPASTADPTSASLPPRPTVSGGTLSAAAVRRGGSGTS